jgi:hypothetical protein
MLPGTSQTTSFGYMLLRYGDRFRPSHRQTDQCGTLKNRESHVSPDRKKPQMRNVFIALKLVWVLCFCEKKKKLMLIGKQSAEILARLLADAKSFALQEETLIEQFEAKFRECGLTPRQCAIFEALLSRSARFYAAVVILKVSLAQQGKALGSN